MAVTDYTAFLTTSLNAARPRQARPHPSRMPHAFYVPYGVTPGSPTPAVTTSTTNLLIGYPQFVTPYYATVGASNTTDTGYPAANVIGGGRGQGTRLDGDNTYSWVRFDVTAATACTVEFFYVARANLCKAAGSTKLFLERSNDGISWTDVCGTSDFQNLTLYGPRSEDALFTEALANSTRGSLPSTPSGRYWKYWVADGAVSDTWEHSKGWFGSFFDFGRDPDYPRQVNLGTFGPHDREPHHLLTFTWSGVSDTVKNAFVDTLLKNADQGVFLYTRSYHDVLFDFRVLHCMIVAHDIRIVMNGHYQITVVFEELL